MAAPSVPGAGSAHPTDFLFTHTGTPDYSVVADVVTLGGDPMVHLEGHKHPLVEATPFAPWSDSPAVPPATDSPGKCLPQSVLDLWCLAGGAVTQEFKNYPNVLLRSIRPAEAGKLFAAHLLVGDLDLSTPFTERSWMNALITSAASCKDDSRVQLTDGLFYKCEPRPSSGAGSSANDSWMYQWSGELLVEDDTGAVVAGLLMRATSPRGIVSSRDNNSSNFRRYLNAVKNVACTRSDFFRSAMSEASTPVEEVKEYLSDTWRKVVATGFTFKLGSKMSRRSMELDSAAQLAFGTSAQQEQVNKSQLPEELTEHPLICKCIGDSTVGQNAMNMESFELLADIFYPGSKWATISMVKAVELELTEMKHLIEAWMPSLTVAERMVALRSHLRTSKQMVKSVKMGGDSQELDETAGYGIGPSGVQAIRSAAFIKTREAIKALLDTGISATFTSVLDLLSESESKMWRAVAYGKLKKATGIEQIESCSKHVGHWAKYWTIGLATQSDGSVITEAQGESQSDSNTEGLLSGKWGSGINWIQVVQSLDDFCFAIEPGEPASYAKFATLTAVKETVCKTMEMLKLASPSDRGIYTAAGFFDRIIMLERRSRALPKGSVARHDARAELVEIMLAGLDEFGERWVNQFKQPMNYSEPMITTFSDSNCFIFNKLDIAEDTAKKTYQFRKLLLKKDSSSSIYKAGVEVESSDEDSPPGD